MTIVGVAPSGFHGVEVGELGRRLRAPHDAGRGSFPPGTGVIGDWRVRWLTLMARLKDGVTPAQAKAGADVLYGQLLEEDFKTIKSPSERFRTAFFEKKLDVLPGGQRHLRPARRVADAAPRAHGHGGSRPPHRLRQRGQPAPRPRVVAPEGGRAAARPRGQPPPARAPVPRGEPPARPPRRSRGRRVRGLDRATSSCAPFPSSRPRASSRPSPTSAWASSRSACPSSPASSSASPPRCRPRGPRSLPTLKNESTAVASGGAPVRFRKGLVVAQIAALAPSPDRSRPLHPQPRQPPQPESRVPARAPAHLLARPRPERLPLERRLALLKQVQDDLAAEPGVSSVSLAAEPLMTDSNTSSTVRVEGYEPKDDEDMNPNFNSVGPAFFETLGITLITGRDFADGDGMAAPKVAVVNETFARYFFGDKTPWAGGSAGDARGEIRHHDRGARPRRQGGLPAREAAALRLHPLHAGRPGGRDDVLRALRARPHRPRRPRAQRWCARSTPTLPVTNLKTMHAQIRESLFVDRLVAGLAAAFGARGHAPRRASASTG